MILITFHILLGNQRWGYTEVSLYYNIRSAVNLYGNDFILLFMVPSFTQKGHTVILHYRHDDII